MLVVAVLALLAIGLYQQDGAGNLARAETVFGLKYFPVQPVGHFVDEHAVLHEHGVLLVGHVCAGRGPHHELIGSRLAWVAVGMALIGTWCAGTKAT
jgi:hypothetical protein